jgi:hypothetical protein
VLSDAVLSGWCDGALGAAADRVLFRRQHLSQVVALVLTDGRQVVVKARPFEARITGCVAVQAALAQAGFPCPVPLAGPAKIGGYAVTAEALVPGGVRLAPARGARPFAALLAQLIKAAPLVTRVAPLAPSPPWAGWDHPGVRLWPDRDDRVGDLNGVAGPAWVDRAARLVRAQMSAWHADARVGHGDWESQNIAWQDGTALAVHDWDSVIAQPEPAIVGLAAAVWPAAGGPGEAACVNQTAAFIDAYQAAAGATWTGRQVQAAWTAGLWVRLFNAKKDAADGGGPQLERLAAEMPERLSMAGLTHAHIVQLAMMICGQALTLTALGGSSVCAASPPRSWTGASSTRRRPPARASRRTRLNAAKIHRRQVSSRLLSGRGVSSGRPAVRRSGPASPHRGRRRFARDSSRRSRTARSAAFPPRASW